ncbi:MAG: cyclic nucleotide-binding domain-containing protein [Rhodothermales bacterium]|nr:cyclic nucleotide-binding domain-containing protein [Rhodothermales bacterium]
MTHIPTHSRSDAQSPARAEVEAHHDDLDALRVAYFSDPRRRLTLKKGETLLRTNERNTRLFMALRGSLSARIQDADGSEYELFRATKGMFVGVYSLFSRTYRSWTHIVAQEDAELAYLESDVLKSPGLDGTILYERFMPIIIAEMMIRHQRAKELVIERVRTIESLIESKKMISLGQMAAGIAHELNNAVAVLQRNTVWLSEGIGTLVDDEHASFAPNYHKGVEDGRTLASREVRARTKELEALLKCSREVARLMAEASLPEDAVDPKDPDFEAQVRAGHRFWEFGAAFHDMRLAAKHATHVVKSMKSLGAKHATRHSGTDLNESIQEALTLLRSPLRRVHVNTSLARLPAITANSGELVQIWTNLIKNAAESMHQAKTPEPTLHVTTSSAEMGIRVEILDNGPGISSDVLPRIFQPDVTTKVGGLTFGLGLGLTIVERLVHDYGGTIVVDSEPGATKFTVDLPTTQSHA